MKVVNPESLGLDPTVLENIRKYLNDTYVEDGKICRHYDSRIQKR